MNRSEDMDSVRPQQLLDVCSGWAQPHRAHELHVLLATAKQSHAWKLSTAQYTKTTRGQRRVFLAISLTLRKMWRPLAHEICKWSVQLHFFRQGARCHTLTLLPHRSLWRTDPRCGDVLLSHGPGYTPFTNLLRNIHHLQSQFYLKYWSPNMNFEQRYA